MAEEHESGGLLHKKLFGLPAPVVLGAGALLVWFVLAHRSAGGGVAPAAAGAPNLSGGVGGSGTGAGTALSLQDQMQQEQLAYHTALDALNLKAAQTGFQQSQAALQNFGTPSSPVVSGSEGGHTTYSYGQGATSKAWQQVTIGGVTEWEDRFHPGHIISDSQAQQLAPQDSGPYASGANKITLSNVFNYALNVVRNLATSGTPITLGNVGASAAGFPVGPTPQPQPDSSTVSPSTAPATPYYTPSLISSRRNRLLK